MSTPDAPLTAEHLARSFHEAYERLAPNHGYETREASAKPWAEVPANNRALMTAVCAEVMLPLLADHARLTAELAKYGPLTDAWMRSENELTVALEQARAELRKAHHVIGERAISDLLADGRQPYPTADAYNRHFGYGMAVAIPGAENPEPELDEEVMLIDPDDGRAYTMSTSNPEGLWDWWVIGGRWQRHFIGKPTVDRSALVFGRPGTGGERADRPHRAETGGIRCDGGQLSLLDFDAMRDAAAVVASAEYDKWDTVCAATPDADSWPAFTKRVDAGEITIDRLEVTGWASPRSPWSTAGIDSGRPSKRTGPQRSARSTSAGSTNR